jgi:hypothetical protein
MISYRADIEVMLDQGNDNHLTQQVLAESQLNQ